MNEKPMKIILGLIGFLALVFVYSFGVFVFSNYTYPKTYINGQNRKMVALTDLIEGDQAYELLVRDQEGHKVRIKSKDIQLKKVYDGFEIQQNPYFWFFEIFERHDYNPRVRQAFSNSALKRILQDSDLMLANPRPPQNAHVEGKGRDMKVVAEEEGRVLDLDSTVQAVQEAINREEKELALTELQYMMPTIKEADLVQEADFIRRLKKTLVTLEVLDERVELEAIDYFEAVDGQIQFNENQLRGDLNQYRLVEKDLEEKEGTTTYLSKVRFTMDVDETLQAIQTLFMDTKPQLLEAKGDLELLGRQAQEEEVLVESQVPQEEDQAEVLDPDSF